MTKKTIAAKIVCSGLLMTTILTPTSFAIAQDGESVTKDEIIVSGVRKSLQQSIERKRSASTGIDSITATDLGRFPDENIAESLQRVTGVQINRVRGEGSTISIRGFNREFSQITINGRILPSATDLGQGTLTGDGVSSRVFDFSVLPSEFVSALDVYKGSLARLEEGGLSGTVDIKTPRPLDIGKNTFSVAAQGSHESNSGKISPRLSGIGSYVFGDGNLGVTFGAAFSRRQPETHIARTQNSYFPTSDLNNDSVLDDPGLFVERVDHFIVTEERDRTSLIGTLQYQPTDDINLTFDGFYSNLDVLKLRNTLLSLPNILATSGPSTAVSTIEVVDPQTGDPLTVSTANFAATNEFRGGNRIEDRTSKLLALGFNGEFEGDLWKITVDAGWSESQSEFSNLNLANQILRPAISTVIGDGPGIDVSDAVAADLLDSTNYVNLGANGLFDGLMDDKVIHGQFDFETELDKTVLGGLSLGQLAIGAKYTERDQTGRFPFLIVGRPIVNGLPGFDFNNYANIIAPGSGDFLAAAPNTIAPGTWLVSDSVSFYQDYPVADLLAAGGAVDPRELQNIDVSENVFSVYGQLDYALADGIIEGNVGVRYVRTDQTSIGVAPDLTSVRIDTNSGGETQADSLGEISVARTYDNILPSFNLKYNASDDIVVRLGASRTLARPALADLSPATTIDLNLNAFTGAVEVSSGNPNLEPYLSTNIDVSFEWYYGDGSAFTTAFFFKDLESLIANTVQPLAPLDILDIATNTVVTRTDGELFSKGNVDGVTSKGFEIAIQQNLDMVVEGLGFLGNYTFVDVSDVTLLNQTSRHNFNASGYYEQGAISARLSYTWRDSFVNNAFGARGAGQITQSFGILDANLTYDVLDNVSAVVEVINVLDEGIEVRDGFGNANSFVDSGRRVLFGIKARF